MQSIMQRGAITIFFALFLSAFPALAQSTKIVNFTYGGNGCPDRSATGMVSPDQKALTVIFDKFQAKSGPGLRPSDNRAFCQLLVDLRFDPGWQVTIYDATFRGFADLQAGVGARHETSYYFTGSPLTSGPITWSRKGPFTGNFTRTDAVATQVWSECGTQRPLNIKTNLYVTNQDAPARSGTITNDATDLQVRITYGLKFRRCP